MERISITDGSFCLLCAIVLIIICLPNFVENDGSCFILCEAVSNGINTSLIIIARMLKLGKDSIYLLLFSIKEQLFIYIYTIIENNIPSHCDTYNTFSIVIVYVPTLINIIPIPVICKVVSSSTRQIT